jgi:hypothetical protein
MVLSTINQQSSSVDDTEDASDDLSINQEELRTLKKSRPKGKRIFMLRALSSRNLRKPSPAQLLKRSNSSNDVHTAKARKVPGNKKSLLERTASFRKSRPISNWSNLDDIPQERSDDFSLHHLDQNPNTTKVDDPLISQEEFTLKRSMSKGKRIPMLRTLSSENLRKPSPAHLMKRYNSSNDVLAAIARKDSGKDSVKDSLSKILDRMSPISSSKSKSSDFCSDDFTTDSEPHKDGVSEEMNPGLQFAPSAVSAHLTERVGQIDESSARNDSPHRIVKKSRPPRKLATEEEYSTKIESSSSSDGIDSSRTTRREGARKNRRRELQDSVSMGNAPMATDDNGGVSSKVLRQKSAGSASLDIMRSPKGQRQSRKDKGYITSFLGNSLTSFDSVPEADSRT